MLCSDAPSRSATAPEPVRDEASIVEPLDCVPSTAAVAAVVKVEPRRTVRAPFDPIPVIELLPLLPLEQAAAAINSAIGESARKDWILMRISFVEETLYSASDVPG